MYSETSSERRESDIAIGSRKKTASLALVESHVTLSALSARILPRFYQGFANNCVKCKHNQPTL